MFIVIRFRHQWADNEHTRIRTQVIYNGNCIALAIVNLENGTVDITAGSLDQIPENPPLQEKTGKSKTELDLDALKKSAQRWAERHK